MSTVILKVPQVKVVPADRPKQCPYCHSETFQRWGGLSIEIDKVFKKHSSLYDHRKVYPWLTGALGDPEAGIWFVAENPSLTQVERVMNPDGSAPTPEAQWWSSRGDKLFREMLVKHGFKKGSIDSPDGWHCYITNVIKEADYTQHWREKTQDARNRAADIWSDVLAWELTHSKPKLVVVMGKQTAGLVDYLISSMKISLPRRESLTHYAYIGQRAQGKLGPMHPDRIKAYDLEFSRIGMLFRSL